MVWRRKIRSLSGAFTVAVPGDVIRSAAVTGSLVSKWAPTASAIAPGGPGAIARGATRAEPR